VFRATGGEPAFVYCSALPPPDSQNVAFQCWGADKCQTSSCPSSTDWTVIASADRPFVVPKSFFEPHPVTVPQPTATPVPQDDLSALIGTWNFTYTIISTFTDTFHLATIQQSGGIELLVGTDQSGNPAVVARSGDLVPGSSSGFNFALVTKGPLICEGFVFNQTGANSVSGLAFVFFEDATGNCIVDTSNPFAMTGVRISTSALTVERSTDALSDGALRAHATTLLRELRAKQRNRSSVDALTRDADIPTMLRALESSLPQ